MAVRGDTRRTTGIMLHPGHGGTLSRCTGGGTGGHAKRADCSGASLPGSHLRVTSSAFETIGEALAKHEEVRIAGFGTFGTKNRPARTGRNPRTGEAVSIPASVAPAFRAGKALEEAVNGR